MLRLFVFAPALFALAGCAAPGVAEAPTAAPAPAAAPRPEAPEMSFEEWRAGFLARAVAAGIAPGVAQRTLAAARPVPRVLELDAFQPEFTRPIWDYLDSAVSAARIANGREKLAAHGAALARIEATYGVEREVVIAVWGLESAYGANRGSMSVVDSLATLAWEGRRRDFAEAQLLAALRILEAGETTQDRLVGSWAGAMGHTQFIPTSYADYAVDYDGDGRRNIWGEAPEDALASTANYLARFGWTRGQPWGVEARLPTGFDFALADQTARPVSEWRALGVTAADGGPLPDHGSAGLLLPAGAGGPVFAFYGNFDVIRRYNNATSYALAIGHLADRIAGGAPFRADWPRGEPPLSRSETVEMQERLTALGHDTKGADGVIGPLTRAAIRDFQRARGLAPDGYASARLLAALRQAGG
ncbi:MAG: lytic murein transglycosylase [Pikeienuella sp.]|uniref:lytic murein transglycosylase n=1 Tax=Pikeienuella sp. TaxID=2831957 RepID=UPI00391CE1E8